MKSITPTHEIELTLNVKERDIILAYRATDDRGQENISWSASYEAKRWPRREGPTLHLVTGSAS